MNPFLPSANKRFLAGALLLSLTPVLNAQTRHTQPPTDGQILARVQRTLHSEPAFNGLTITPSVAHGVVTLEGTVDSQAAKVLASNEIAGIGGIKTVLNNLTVAGPAFLPAPAPPPALPAPVALPTPIVSQESSRTITLPEGTTLPVRLLDEIDTKTAQPNGSFQGTTSANVSSGGFVLIPAGTPVTGRIVDAKSAGHFSGSAELSVELVSAKLGGTDTLALNTQPLSNKASGRGTNTAEKTAGGAGIGAVIGALAGGGSGAAIGAASGGALGAGTNAITRGKEIDLKPEQLLQFRTSAPLEITVKLRNGVQILPRAAGGPALEMRPPETDATPQR